MLSAHFTLDELVRSSAAARLGFDNTPNPEHIRELRRLCQFILEPLRAHLGMPVVVESGYRSRQVNYAIHGAQNSEHMDGRAADIIVPGRTPLQVCEAIRALDLPFRQLIHEFRAWCHVSVATDEDAAARELLTSYRQYGLTRYAPGLIP